MTFPEPTLVTGVRFWNYNKSLEDAYRGARRCHASADARPLSPPEGWFLRKAVGHARFDNGQTIAVPGLYQPTDPDSTVPAPSGAAGDAPASLAPLVPWYVMPSEPSGLLLEIRLLATNGDAYYLGLNGLALLDKWVVGC